VVKLAAAPERGRANQLLLSFLAAQMGLSASQLSIVKGETQRHKIVSAPKLVLPWLSGFGAY
jgi:uncharacterized protein YggU (UPF0235/DUF167 family)